MTAERLCAKTKELSQFLEWHLGGYKYAARAPGVYPSDVSSWYLAKTYDEVEAWVKADANRFNWLLYTVHIRINTLCYDLDLPIPTDVN